MSGDGGTGCRTLFGRGNHGSIVACGVTEWSEVPWVRLAVGEVEHGEEDEGTTEANEYN